MSQPHQQPAVIDAGGREAQFAPRGNQGRFTDAAVRRDLQSAIDALAFRTGSRQALRGARRREPGGVEGADAAVQADLGRGLGQSAQHVFDFGMQGARRGLVGGGEGEDAKKRGACHADQEHQARRRGRARLHHGRRQGQNRQHEQHSRRQGGGVGAGEGPATGGETARVPLGSGPTFQLQCRRIAHGTLVRLMLNGVIESGRNKNIWFTGPWF